MGTIRLGKRIARAPKINEFVPLADLNDIVFGGWDIFEEDCYAAARTAGVLDPGQLEQVRDELEAVKPMPAVFDQRYVKRLDGPNVKKGKNKRDLADQVVADIRAFKSKHDCDRLVMIWTGSTEVFMKQTAAHASVAAFEKALEQSDDAIPSSMVYAYAAIREGIPFANAAPNLTADIPAMLELAGRTKAPLAGNDMKTGQTLIKTIIAPGLKARLIGVRAGTGRTSSAIATAKCSTIPSRSRPRKKARNQLWTISSSRICIPSSTTISLTSSASTTIRRAATTKRGGTTSTSSAGSAIRCS